MPAKINLINERFGKLLVVRESQIRKRNLVTWECQCDCGNITLVTTKELRNGTTQSCGCLKKKNLLGQRFGKLTVIDYTNETRNNSAVWKCQCDCGNIIYATSEGLRVGDNTTCGNQSCRTKRQDKYEQNFIGRRFGNLVVNKKSAVKHQYGSLWECQCDCGNTILVTTNHLITNNTQSCGCLQGKSIGEQNIKKLLDEYNISYKQEYVFSELPNRRYDFAILNQENEVIQLIEFDGEQHYQEVPFFKKTLEQQQLIDLEKNNFAILHNIKLVRIPFWKRNNLTLNDLEIVLDEQK